MKAMPPLEFRQLKARVGNKASAWLDYRTNRRLLEAKVFYSRAVYLRHRDSSVLYEANVTFKSSQ